MSGIETTIISGDAIAVNSPASTPCVVACSPVAATSSVWAFPPGSKVYDVLGQGLSADGILYLLRNSNSTVVATVAAATWSAPPAVTHLDALGGNSPTGPSVSVGLMSSAPGCLDDHNLILTVRSTGAQGVAKIGLSYSGGPSVANGGAVDAFAFTAPMPLPGQLVGTAPITPTTLGALDGLTLIFTEPASKTLTFTAGSLAAAGAGLLAATATVTGGATLTPDIPAGVAALLANPRRISVTSAGTTADVPAALALAGFDFDGNALAENVTPDTSAGTVYSVGVYAVLTSATYASASGTAATMALGYYDAMANVAELVAAVNALAAAAPLAITATQQGGSLGVYLVLSTTATGSAATITFGSSPGTAVTALGFTASETSTGAAATMNLPASGLMLTFPSGTYPLNETYLIPCVGPRPSSVTAVTNAAQAAVTQYNANGFGYITVPFPAPDAPTAAALIAATDAQRATWLANPIVPRDIYFCIGGPWHTASQNPTTNVTNVTTTDQATLTAFQSAASSVNSVAHDDVYVQGSPTLATGHFRRSAALTWTEMRAAAPRLAATVAEGTIPEVQLVADDGLTLARDEGTAVVPLGQLNGPGFFVHMTNADGVSISFQLGATRAGATSRLRHDGDVAVCYEVARIVQILVGFWKAQRPDTDDTTGMLASYEKLSRASQVYSALQPTLLPDAGASGTGAQQALPNVTDFSVLVTDPPTGRFTDNGIVPVYVTLNVLGTIVTIAIVVAATGTTVTVTQGPAPTT